MSVFALKPSYATALASDHTVDFMQSGFTNLELILQTFDDERRIGHAAPVTMKIKMAQGIF
jgi:hypothetical protein